MHQIMILLRVKWTIGGIMRGNIKAMMMDMKSLIIVRRVANLPVCAAIVNKQAQHMIFSGKTFTNPKNPIKMKDDTGQIIAGIFLIGFFGPLLAYLIGSGSNIIGYIMLAIPTYMSISVFMSDSNSKEKRRDKR